VIVEAEGLVKEYGGTRALDGIDLAVPEGSVLALLGPNGAGKTTTVRVLATLTRPDAGRATIAGHDVVRDPARVRATISLTGQHAAVDDRQTGRENLVMIGRLSHLGRRGAHRRADDLLDRFDLSSAADRRVGQWSGGMRRRLDLAMSLVATPRVVFLDEPTTGLDPVSRITMWDAIAELVRTGTTLVLTTQYLEEADRLADQIVLVDGGQVSASGTPDELKARVGGDRLDLWFADPAALDRAGRLLAGAGTVPDRAGLRLGVASDGSAAHVHRVLDRLAGGGVPVLRLAPARPTLDDVFLALTGGHASPTGNAASPAADRPVALTATA
jgi:ABC-2 type transport system ATP-binding protein